MITNEDFNESNKGHLINYIGLVIALTEKGVLTSEEIEKSRPKATHIVDQIWEEKKRESEKSLAEESPGIALFNQLLSGDGL